MKRILTLMMLLIATNIFSQIKTVIITQYPQKVPTGKKWVLSSNTQTKIQISRGALNSGTFCNAMFFSNPHIIYNINRGDINQTESFGIIFKDIQKVPYTNDITFSITPVAIIDKNFSLSQLQHVSPEHIGQREISFNEGESVFVSSCLESIEVKEIDYVATDNSIVSSKTSGTNTYLRGFPNRKFLIKPIVENPKNRFGVIVVDIQVDNDGNVVSAHGGARGTTIIDTGLYKKCERALLNSKLSPVQSPPNTQSGSYTFVMKTDSQ